MRYNNFSGLAPKYKPQRSDPSYAQVAHNVDLYSRALRPLRAPTAQGAVMDVFGAVRTTPAETLYQAGTLWVGFSEHTWVIPDTVGALETDRFLFVMDQKLWWQSAVNILTGVPPVPVGIAPPCVPPTAAAIVGMGCTTASPALQCVTPETGECIDRPAQLYNYVYTYVRYYAGCEGRMDESAPSPPVTAEMITGDAVALGCPPLPDDVDAVRWYREISGAENSIYLFAGETTTPTFLDDLCPEELSEPLGSTLHYEPPSCITGVAQLGDACTVVWHGKHFWVSEPNKPGAYDVDRNQYDLPFPVVAMRGVVTRTEGGTTYDAHALTTGKPYKVTGNLPEAMQITENQDWYPCVSVHSVCDMRGQTGYASPYGFVVFSGTNVVNLTDNYMTEKEWGRYEPHLCRAVWWNERVWMGWPAADGFVLTVEEEGGMRPKTLTTHGVRVVAWHAAADTRLHLSRPGSKSVFAWGEGAPLWMVWHGPEEVQVGLWKPAAVKIVSTHARRRYDLDEVYAVFTGWAAARADADATQFVQEHPQWRHLLDQLLACPHLCLKVYRDGRLVYNRAHKDSRPLRIPRSVRALEWSVRVEGFAEVREVHMQSSITDMTQGGGHA